MAERIAPVAVDRVGEAIANLPTESWTVLHDLRIPGRRQVVGHVLVGPSGVHVVSSDKWQGQVRERAVRDAADAADAVASYLTSVIRDDVRPVLCHDTDEYVDAWSAGVVVASASTVVELVSARRAVLEPDEVEAAVLELSGLASPVDDVKRPVGSHRAATERRRSGLRLVRRSAHVAL